LVIYENQINYVEILAELLELDLAVGLYSVFHAFHKHYGYIPTAVDLSAIEPGAWNQTTPQPHLPSTSFLRATYFLHQATGDQSIL
jgi:hypothetical protein